MNDFDFEELDKAVNDLAAKTHDEHGAPELTAPHVVLASQPAAAAKSTTEISSAPAPTPESSESDKPSPEPATPAAEPQRHSTRLSETRPRSRGSFMDIVPPVSRNKPGTRVGVSLQPLSKPEDIIAEEPAEPESQTIPPVDESKAPKVEAPKPVEVEKSQAEIKDSGDVAWPDPLDFHDQGQNKQEEKPEQSEESPEATSPFLAEAKVEKRPLGAFSNFRAKPQEKLAVEESKPEPIKDELTPEKDGIFKEPEAESKEKPKAPTAAESEFKEKPSKPDMHSAAMMSIPQQYHTEAKATDKTTHPVFDTKEYHPPLLEAATGEHRGGGMWGKLFIALIVLVLLGVAAYFTYLYVMQR